MRIQPPVLAFIAALVLTVAAVSGFIQPMHAAAPQTVAEEYRTVIVPLLQRYCLKCHGDAAPQGDIRLDGLTVDFVRGSEDDLEIWHDALQNLYRGEMPPRGESQPTTAEHARIVDWLNRAFLEARQQREDTGGRGIGRRLTAYEYRNTLEDLLQIQLPATNELLPEVPSRNGFFNNGTSLATSSQHVKTFWATARRAMSLAIVTGERPQTHAFRFTEFLEHFAARPRRYRGSTTPPANQELRGVLLPDTVLMVPLDHFPTEGRFRIRINLNATGLTTCLSVWSRLGVNGRRLTMLAKPEVSSSPESQNVDIYGNVEELPRLIERLATKPIGKSAQIPRAGYVCVANVGRIHDLARLRDNAQRFSTAVDALQAKEFLAAQAGDPQSTPDVPVVRLNWIEIEAPFFESWPPPSHRHILFESPNVKNESVYAREVIERFLQQAFRRPATNEELDRYDAFFQNIRPQLDSLAEAMRETLAAVLVSPQFLILSEPRTTASKEPVNDHEWAARLSYFLWNSMPDAELMSLAEQGALRTPVVRTEQVERLLRDKRCHRFIETFTDQWLGVGGLDTVAVNPEFHPDFDDDIKQDMRRETQLFFHDLLARNESCLKLVNANFTYLNNRLADHYGIAHGPGTGLVLSSALRRVSLLPAHQRSCGILSQGAPLLLNSDGVESHLIKRAVWIRNTIFDDPPPDPPAEVPDLKTDDRMTSPLTLKDRISQHRTSPTCANCHARVDPWGVPLEQYDALGRFRDVYRPLTDSVRPRSRRNGNKPELTVVDARVDLPDGHDIQGVEGLRDYIVGAGRERFARGFVRKLLAYALGRSVELSDQPIVEDLTRRFAAGDYRIRSLIVMIAQSEAFLTK